MLNEITMRTTPALSMVVVCKNREVSLKEVLPIWVKQSNIKPSAYKKLIRLFHTIRIDHGR